MVEKEGSSNSEYITKLKAYVDAARKKGIKDEQIKAKLKENKVSDDVLNQVFGFNRDDDVIKPEEFDQLEKKENKNFIKNLFVKNKEKKVEQAGPEQVDVLSQWQVSYHIDRLHKLVEAENVSNGKQDGKIDLLNEKNDEIEEELEGIGERMGELRSTVMGRERMFNKLEDDFNQVKFVVQAFKPDMLEKRFNEVNSQMLKMTSQLEKMSTKMQKLEEKVDVYNNLMQSIKSYENVLNKLHSLQKTEDDIEKLKLDIDKTTSKMEVMYGNLEDSVGKISITNSLARNNEDAIRDVVLSMTKMDAQLDFFVKREDFEVIKNDLSVIKKTLFDREFSKKTAQKK